MLILEEEERGQEEPFLPAGPEENEQEDGEQPPAGELLPEGEAAALVVIPAAAAVAAEAVAEVAADVAAEADAGPAAVPAGPPANNGEAEEPLPRRSTRSSGRPVVAGLGKATKRKGGRL